MDESDHSLSPADQTIDQSHGQAISPSPNQPSSIHTQPPALSHLTANRRARYSATRRSTNQSAVVSQSRFGRAMCFMIGRGAPSPHMRSMVLVRATIHRGSSTETGVSLGYKEWVYADPTCDCHKYGTVYVARPLSRGECFIHDFGKNVDALTRHFTCGK